MSEERPFTIIGDTVPALPIKSEKEEIEKKQAEKTKTEKANE